MRHLSLLVNDDDVPEIADDLPGIGRHVLVVDEQQFRRRLTRHRLERDGFTVTFADDLWTIDGRFDAVVSTAALFLALGATGDEEDMPLIVTLPEEDAEDDDLRERLYALGATAVVDDHDVPDAVLEVLWAQKPRTPPAT